MSFFKKYNGTVNKRLARLEKLIWFLIYGGLLSALIGFFVQRGGDEEGQWLMVAGASAAVLGLILIVVRARIEEDPDTAKAPQRGPRRR